MPRRLALVALAACHGTPAAIDAARDAVPDAKPDAMPDAYVDPRLACLGQDPPWTVADPLVVTGKLFAIDHYQVTPLAGAAVTMHHRGHADGLGQATTAGDGSFTFSVATGGVAPSAAFTVAAAGYRPTEVDPIDPVIGSQDVLLVVAHDDELARWYDDAGSTYTAGDRTLIAVTVDCHREALPDTTIAVAPATPVTYYNDPAKRWDPALAASTNGYALIPHAPATLTVTARSGTASFPPATLAIPAGTLEIAVVTPHARQPP